MYDRARYVCVCVRACVLACVRACVHASMHAYLHACLRSSFWGGHGQAFMCRQDPVSDVEDQASLLWRLAGQ